MTTKTLRLTARDVEVLDALASYRLLNVPQLTALFFDSEDATRRRLAAFLRARLVTRVFSPVAPHDRRVTPIFALARAGAAQLRQRSDGEHVSYVARPQKGLALDHTLRRNDLRVVLELLHRDHRGLQLLSWRQRPEEVGGSVVVLRRGVRRRIPCVPDGYFALQVEGQVAQFLVEVDLGTVAVRKMADRYAAYYHWWKSGGLRQRFGPAPLRVLTLTTTPARLSRLREAAMMAGGHTRGSGLFWLARLDLVDTGKPEALLSRAWQVARRDDGDLHSITQRQAL